MRCIITTEEHFAHIDGHIGSYNPLFWDRYLQVFDNIIVVARVSNTSSPAVHPITNPKISFLAIPEYIGPKQFLQKYLSIKSSIKVNKLYNSALISRVPSTIGNLVIKERERLEIPFGLEVVGDPQDVFAPGVVSHPLQRFFRYWFAKNLYNQCRRAAAVAYVTRSYLQQRYPPSPMTFTTSYSSIDLPSSAFCSGPRQFNDSGKIFHLVSIGSQDQLYKGFDLLIYAISVCVKNNLSVEASIAGTGRYQALLVELTRSLGLEDTITFLGHVEPKIGIPELLDKADIFILPSRTEGLPRVMIEAMARGLPCIGSTVGGIPELLQPEDMVPPGDIQALATKISEVISNPSRMNTMSQRNVEKAKEYAEYVLRERRTIFYEKVRSATEHWLVKRERA